MSLNETNAKVLRAIETEPGITGTQLQNWFEGNNDKVDVRVALKSLENAGHIRWEDGWIVNLDISDAVRYGA